MWSTRMWRHPWRQSLVAEVIWTRHYHTVPENKEQANGGPKKKQTVVFFSFPGEAYWQVRDTYYCQEPDVS